MKEPRARIAKIFLKKNEEEGRALLEIRIHCEALITLSAAVIDGGHRNRKLRNR